MSGLRGFQLDRDTAVKRHATQRVDVPVIKPRKDWNAAVYGIDLAGPDGIVRNVHVGASADLATTLSEEIEATLADLK